MTKELLNYILVIISILVLSGVLIMSAAHAIFIATGGVVVIEFLVCVICFDCILTLIKESR